MKLLNFLDNIADKITDKIWDSITDKFWNDDPSVNHHVGFAIWSHPFTGSYEHQDDLEIVGSKIKEKIEKGSQGNG